MRCLFFLFLFFGMKGTDALAAQDMADIYRSGLKIRVLVEGKKLPNSNRIGIKKDLPVVKQASDSDRKDAKAKKSNSSVEKILAKPPDFNYSFFSRIPVLHAGRIKPLSTFAREHLLALYGKNSFSDCSAESWLAETLFDPQSAFERKIFKIWNPDIIDILKLKRRKKSFYSFNEMSVAFDKILEDLNVIKDKKHEERTLVENQLLNLYGKTLVYFQLSRSLSLILPLFSVQSSVYAEKTGLIPGKKYSYLEVLKFHQKIKKEVKKKNFNQLSDDEMELLALSFKMDMVSKDENNDLFRIIPPQWKDNKELWHSPWNIIKTGRGSPASAAYLDSWVEMERAYRTKTEERDAVEKVYHQAMKLSSRFVSSKILFLEKIFNDLKFFQKSLLFYILGMLFLFFGNLLWKKGKEFLLKLSLISLVLGLLFHFTGILFRIFILARPPVATLYESIIFVGLIVVVFSLFLHKWKKGNETLLVGSVAGSFLHLLALKYKGIESMELLVPVLNTNFWLASHVLCITIGYGCALVTSLTAHIYTFLKCFGKNFTQDTFLSLYKNIMGAGFLALFFCLFGTILGGIWADQSWGRFWGWDPKENGALFIVLWFLVLLHGRLAGILKMDGYALGHILTNVAVALSWFGVNLLNVGLHSYGFIKGVAWGLSVFCGLEFAFFLFALVKLSYSFPGSQKIIKC